MTAAATDLAFPSLNSTEQKPPTLARPLRIALLGYRSHPFVGGQGIYLKYLSRALTELGHQVDVISGEPYPELDEAVNLIKLPGLNLYEHPDPLRGLHWRQLKEWPLVYEWLSKMSGGFGEPKAFGLRLEAWLENQGQHYDVIHDNQSLCSSLLRIQARGCKVVSTIHHPICRDRALALAEAKTRWDKLFVKRWYGFVKMQKQVSQKLEHVVTVSQTSREDIETHFGRPQSQTLTIPNGVDTQVFVTASKDKRQSYRLLTTTSSDQAIKGFSVLLQALAELRSQYPQVKLVVIGQLKKEGTNAALLKALSLEDCVEFKSGISTAELVNEYHQAHVAICPSLYEGFGLPACEAMACGTPLVSSDGGALAEVIADAGILVPAGSAASLARGIKSVFDDPELAEALSQRGRKRVEQHYSWARVAQQMTDVYYSILDGVPATTEKPIDRQA